LGAGFLFLSRVQNLWQFYLAFVLMSSGAGLGTWLPMMTVLNNWFLRRRSTAMAVAMTGFSIGGVLLVPALAWAIDPDALNRSGWRTTALGTGVVTAALAFPISRLVRNRPEDYGEHPDGQKLASAADSPCSSRHSATEDSGYTWQEALRTRSFWLITWGHTCYSIVIVTMMVHLGPMLNDRGFSLQTVGWVLPSIPQ
jgi:sugar phosphate permease